MKYLCDVCGWEYDEEKGYPEGGIAPVSYTHLVLLPAMQTYPSYRCRRFHPERSFQAT